MEMQKDVYLETMCIYNVLLQSILTGRIDVSHCAFRYSNVDGSSHSLAMELIGGDCVIEKMSTDINPGTFFIVKQPMKDGMKDSPCDLVHSNGNKIPFTSHCEVVWRDSRGMRYEAFLYHVADGDMTNDGMYELFCGGR